MTKPSQSHLILRWLKQGRAITPIQALTEFGCFRLGARIWELKRLGHPIEREMVSRGEKRFARYRMGRAA